LKERLIEERFFKNADAYSRYKLFSKIDKYIYSLTKTFPKGPISKAWSDWWENYLNTFLFFRDNSIVVQIFDLSLNIELFYSLEWILQYKEILGVEEIKHEKYFVRKYTVGNLKDRDSDIQYQVNTIPSVGAKENEFLCQKEMYDLCSVFDRSIDNIRKKNKIGVEEINRKQLELLEYVKLLSKTFNRKRLNIIGIESQNHFL